MLVAKYGDDGAALHEAMDAVLADPETPAHVKVDILKFKMERHSGKTPQAVSVSGPEGGPIRQIINRYVGVDPQKPE